MRAEEIREMSDADIRTRVAEMEEERFRLKFRSATETLEDPLRLRTIRRDIARLKTVQRERELAASAETRMGKGKGSPEGWVAVVRPGRVLFELEGVTPEIAQKAMALAAAKIGLKTKFIAKEEAHTDES